MKQKLFMLMRTAFVVLVDILCIFLAGGLALLARFDFSYAAIPQEHLTIWYRYLPVQIGVTVAIFILLRMYRFVWRTVSAYDVERMAFSVLVAYLASTGVLYYVFDAIQPRSVMFLTLLFELLLCVGVRCAFRIWDTLQLIVRQNEKEPDERVMLIGAGEAGRMLAREILTSPRISAELCCVIDDNEAKWGKYMEGVPIIGGRDVIPSAVRRDRINQIIFAIPTASEKDRRDILNICNSTGVHTRTLPGIYQFINGEATLSNVKDVQVEDLLGREPIRLNTAMLDDFLGGKIVMVTGGGGSIGSELCRQIAKRNPKQLIVLDIYENNAYDIQQELKRRYGDKLNLRVEIASIRDKERIYDIFRDLRPDIVFHAAAHKHVPLMEDCPAEAIKNNVFGTYHVVRAAEKFGVKKFVMISTDKAVNPTNVMGATKRFCEMVLQSRYDSPTEYCAVRFGNVLGSNGSVVPVFKRQIEAGGPVTITDRRIIRYFMTIPEAAQLVLEAGAMARQSQIFVLDMGEPVKILDLAEQLIRLSGLEPYRDIEIREIGLRPGEKLYEELLMKSETLLETENNKIFVEQQQEIDPSVIMANLVYLDQAVTKPASNEELVDILRDMIPTYHAPEEVNRAAIQAAKEKKNASISAPDAGTDSDKELILA